MAKLLSGKTLRSGGSGQFIDLKGAQPQLPATDTTTTGYTLVTDSLLRTSYRSSLGNLEMHSGTVYSNIIDGNIVFIGTGTGNVQVAGGAQATGTSTGALTVNGGIGINGNIWTAQDIHVNGLTIGQGYQSPVGGINNIVIKGSASGQLNDFDVGQENIVIGYDALTGISSAYKNIAIGRYALNSGTDLSNSIAIGDSALKNIGKYHTLVYASITDASNTNPVVVTAPGHDLVSGSAVTITGVTGMTEINDVVFYIDVLSTTTFALYSDNILNVPVNGTGFGTYSGSGDVNLDLVWDDNMAIGNNAGENLINGEQNFFMGYSIARNLTTGSYNFFLGHNVAGNMTHGNANISIGGDNLVDGLDNQINIGSVFYYNGNGYLELNADTNVGFGSTASNLTFSSGILNIIKSTATTVYTVDDHGILPGQSIKINSVTGMTELNGNTYYVRTPAPNQLVLYSDPYLASPIDSTGYAAYTGFGDIYKREIIAALSVLGGIGVSDNVVIGSELNSTSTTTGALIVDGGVGIYKDLYVGGVIYGAIDTASRLQGGDAGSLVYQSSTDHTTFLPIGNSGTVLLSDGSAPYWGPPGVTPNAGNADNIYVYTVSSGTTYYLGLTERLDDYSAVDSDTSLTYNTTGSVLTVQNVAISGTATSTSTVTGALIVAGGVGIQGDVYSNTGNPLENNLLYTPQVTITNTGIPPANARVGDFWIDTVIAGQMQYIKDGTSTFWIQVTTI